jgi:hypothetical protein
VSKNTLETLFQTSKGAILLDQEAEEVLPLENGLYPDLDPNITYTVVDEEHLEKFTEDEQQPLMTREEVQHRLEQMVVARRQLISRLYKPKHPHLYNFSEDIFVPTFLDAIKEDSIVAFQKLLKQLTPTRLYTFEMLSPKFCRELIEEVEHFENSGMPVSRPNSMNNYGCILDDFGFTPLITLIREKYISPLARLLYPDYNGDHLDSHHAFIVQYKVTEDKSLNFHYDEAEVTLNVCLGKEFTGGSLYFRGLLADPSTHDENFEVEHKPGQALLHIGRHRHGANPITSGERYNLIIWCRSSSFDYGPGKTPVSFHESEIPTSFMAGMPSGSSAACDHDVCACGHEHDHNKPQQL